MTSCLLHRLLGRRRPGARAGWAALAALPLVLSACITVDQPGDAEDAGASAPASLGAVASQAVVTPGPPRTPPPTPPRVEAEVLGFLPNWLIEGAAETIDTDLLTLLAFHGVEASGDGRLVTTKPSGDVPDGWQALDSDAFVALKAQAQADGVRVILTIQRFGWAEGTLDRTRTLLGSRQDRRALAERIAKLVSERGFDGVNLDFEPMPEDLAADYVDFVREVRAALDAVDPALHLSVDVVASLSGYDLAGLTADGAADLAVIMGYEYRTEGAQVAGSTAPLDDPEIRDIVATLDEALAQVPAEKLVLALPWFGAAWSTETDQAPLRDAERARHRRRRLTVLRRGRRPGQPDRPSVRPRAGLGLDGLPEPPVRHLPGHMAAGLVRRPRRLRRQGRSCARARPGGRGHLGPRPRGGPRRALVDPPRSAAATAR